ncbi:MAG: SLBB domain-containing protein [Victivallales bacterium]
MGALKEFGYDYLKTDGPAQGTSNAILGDYILKSGDEIVIDIWGDVNLHYKLPIQQDGFIDILKVGRVYVHGMELNTAKAKILKALSQAYAAFINADNPGSGSSIVDITLGKNLGIKLFVTGEVAKPGEVNLDAASASVMNALKQGGGVNPLGSLRNIEIRKMKDGKVNTFDLYNFLLKGNLSSEDKYLNDGDIIYVPLRGKTVTLKGAVAKPGIYELKKDENLNKLLEIAGGYSVDAIKEKVKIERYDPVKGEEFLDIDLITGKDIDLYPRDSIRFTLMPIKKVRDILTVSGSGVKNPGTYEYKKGSTLTDLVAQAGGLYKDAYLDNVIILRTNADLTKEIVRVNIADTNNKPFVLNPMDKIIIYSQFEMKGQDKFVSISGIVSNPGKYMLNKDMTLQDLLFMAGGFDDPDRDKKIYMERADLFRKKNLGEFEIIPFNIYEVLGNKTSVKLSSGDSVRIYSVDEIIPKKYIEIRGEIKKPGKYEFTENMNIADLIKASGGFTESANPERVDVGRLKREADIEKKEAILLNYNSNENRLFLLKEKDLVIIPKNPYFNLNEADVVLSGKINFPGTYNYIDNEKLSSLIERSGGFKKNVVIGKAVLKRDGMLSDIYVNEAIEDHDSAQNITVKPSDEIEVMEIQPWVFVSGSVVKPGRYVYKEGEDYLYYVNMAGGYIRGFTPNEILIKTYDGRILNGKRLLWFNPEVPMDSTIDIQ